MNFKAGDTFDFSGPVEVVDGDGTTIDLSDWTVAAAIKLQNAHRVELEAEWLDTEHTLVRLYHNDTGDWGKSTARIDVQFTSPQGAKVSTDATDFTIHEGVT